MTIDSIYNIVPPSCEALPILLSLPHCGTGFPSELADLYVPEMMAAPDDTDWHLDLLYDFAHELGITTIIPKYSRWVIDLNREPESTPLYDDGRLTTDLCPVTDFNGNSIYKDGRPKVSDEDRKERIEKYFSPYHSAIDAYLEGFRDEHGIALLFDGHSIRRHVPTIQEFPFPDFILGDNLGKSTFEDLSLIALSTFDDEFNASYNTPFRGGYITRSKGRPETGIHAMQLEMSKDLYMSENESLYDSVKAEPIKSQLRNLLLGLGMALTLIGGR
ncbi:MAG: N-formylglutamate amidohydrolase [Pyrinomonadaceae bacterium]